MAKVITDGKVKIGAYRFRNKTFPCLCVDDGNGTLSIYGDFYSIEAADDFMNELGELVQAVKNKGGENGK